MGPYSRARILGQWRSIDGRNQSDLGHPGAVVDVAAFIPLLGWGNWFMIPFAVIGALIAAVGLLFTREQNRGRAKAGLALNIVAIVVGVVRLSLGGGLI